MARVFVDAVFTTRFSCVVDAKDASEAEQKVKQLAELSLDGYNDFEVDLSTRDSEVIVISSYKTGTTW